MAHQKATVKRSSQLKQWKYNQKVAQLTHRNERAEHLHIYHASLKQRE
jgi:hypothetical protein